MKNKNLEERATIEIDLNMLKHFEALKITYVVKRGINLEDAMDIMEILPEEQKEIFRIFEYAGFTWFGLNTPLSKIDLGYEKNNTIYLKKCYKSKNIISFARAKDFLDKQTDNLSVKEYYSKNGITQEKLNEINRYFEINKKEDKKIK